MTRTFKEKIVCPSCGFEHTAETNFERWFRNNPSLDSRNAGLVRYDLDVLLHKYMTVTDGKGTRDIQCMMFIEVKTMMAVPSQAQADTLSIFNQVIRNRKPNRHSTPRTQRDSPPCRVYSPINKKEIKLKMYGGHLLQMDGTDPLDSSLMLWDGTAISIECLCKLLRFELDPDNPTIMLDHRRRSYAWNKSPRLFK